MKIVVLVKHVPEPTATWRFADDLTLDRQGVDGRLSELDEYAVEQAVRLVEGGLSAEVVCLTVGPKEAEDSLRKALAMGADAGIHVLDEAMHGSDVLATSAVLAAAIKHAGADLVITGMGSTDAEMSVLPAMISERLGMGQATFARDLSSTGGPDGSVTIRRDGDTGSQTITATLPAVVSVTDQSGEARLPAFKQIMMARKKPVETLSLADLGVETASVGAGAAATRVVGATPTPPREAGTVLTDDGTAAAQLADFLDSRGLL